MTPQLRQAIKLLQFSNLEVAAFVEEELERNPLLERDERPDAPPERPAPDQVAPPAAEDGADAADLVRTDMLTAPEAAPLDAADAEPFDPPGPGDGVMFGRGGAADFAGDERGIEDLVPAPHSRCASICWNSSASASPTAPTAPIGAHLIALLEPSGRLPIAAGRDRRGPRRAGRSRSSGCARRCCASSRPACSPATCASAWRRNWPSRTGSIRRWRHCSTTSTCWRDASTGG